MRTTILSLLFAFTVACGGSNPEPKAPTTDSADPAPAAADPAPAPAADKTPDPPKSEPVKTSAVSNTKDGSDIVPPFTANKDDPPSTTTTSTASKDDAKPAAPAKKKGKSKAKKKNASQ